MKGAKEGWMEGVMEGVMEGSIEYLVEGSTWAVQNGAPPKVGSPKWGATEGSMWAVQNGAPRKVCSPKWGATEGGQSKMGRHGRWDATRLMFAHLLSEGSEKRCSILYGILENQWNAR